METSELIRMSRPEVAVATPQEAAAIKASFERRAAEQPGRFRAFLRRLSRRQLIAGILAVLIVPAGTVAVATQILGNDRSEQIEKAISISPLEQQRKIADGLIDACRDLLARGLENDLCTQTLEQVDQEKGGYVPDP